MFPVLATELRSPPSVTTHPGLDKWPSCCQTPSQLPIESRDQITVANLYNPSSQVSHRASQAADFIGKQDNNRVHHNVSHIPGLYLSRAAVALMTKQ